MLWEVKRSIKRLRNNRSGGVDEVIAEVLKNGGAWMTNSVYELCRSVFEQEQIPAPWLRAIKVPVKKKGKGDSYQEYRGVTLLSVVGKVFGMIMEARLRWFCEQKGILSDSQFGFREDRACRDPLVVVNEMFERRGMGRVFMGFLDIAKAYPSVWRDGLWFKLREMGIEGRMRGVLRSLYSRCEVAVRVGGVADDWYEEFVGLREGCIVSPLLFAIYINGIEEEVMKGGGGVVVGGKRIVCLMFADDIILLAYSKEGLQESFDRVYEYSKKWRFKFNFGKDKTVVMVVGGRKEGEEWWLGGRVVEVVRNYKYLGVRLTENWKLDTRREELLGKARRSFWRAWGMGMRGKSVLSSAGAAELWEVLVRPVLEYGAEVDSFKWEESERLQLLAGRMCLGVGKEIGDEVVRGELGWWSMRGRRVYLRLVYWGKLVLADRDSIVGCVYREGRRRVIDRVKCGRREWCVETKRLLEKIGLGERWEDEKIGSMREWREMVKKMVHYDERIEWRKKMGGKITLNRYMRVKEDLKKERYLKENRLWVRRWVRLRSSTETLRVREGRMKKEMRCDRICECCEAGKVEDEAHMMDECERWNGERERMWRQLEEYDDSLVRIVRGWSRERRVDWMMEGGNKKFYGYIMKWMGRILYSRDAFIMNKRKLPVGLAKRREKRRARRRRKEKEKGEGGG